MQKRPYLKILEVEQKKIIFRAMRIFPESLATFEQKKIFFVRGILEGRGFIRGA